MAREDLPEQAGVGAPDDIWPLHPMDLADMLPLPPSRAGLEAVADRVVDRTIRRLQAVLRIKKLPAPRRRRRGSELEAWRARQQREREAEAAAPEPLRVEDWPEHWRMTPVVRRDEGEDGAAP